MIDWVFDGKLGILWKPGKLVNEIQLGAKLNLKDEDLPTDSFTSSTYPTSNKQVPLADTAS